MTQHSAKSHRSIYVNSIKRMLMNSSKLSIAGTLVVVFLMIRRNRENINSVYSPSLKIRKDRITYEVPQSVIAIITTPEMGAKSLSQSFINSWACKDGKGFPSYLTYDCPNERLIVRAHDVNAGARAIQRSRQSFPEGRCLIVTAIRSPATWFPSLYSQRNGICQSASFTSKDDLFRDYKLFLGDVRFFEQTIDSCLPGLISEFKGGSLREQAKIMNKNGGYSILGPAPSKSVFAGCELLLLRMEQKDRWPAFIKTLVPNITFYAGETHATRCPESTDHIKMIYDYELASEEKMAIYTGAGAIVPDWFDSYGYIGGNTQTQERSYSTPKSVFAVINTPKTGTTGLTQNFIRTWNCEKLVEDPFYLTYGCPDDRLLIRAHQFGSGAQLIQQHRREHPEGSCLVVTSIRHPAAWLPSLYAQKTNICNHALMSKEEMLQDYKLFLSNERMILNAAESSLPGLMNEFSFGSLKEQFKMMDQNGGYTILSPASAESVFAGCELLFLRMEQNEKWPEIIQMMIPENKFSRGKSMDSKCPNLSDHLKMLREYELTMEEKMRIYKYGGGLMSEWFDAYDYVSTLVLR